jgi:Ca2+/Na+ antiporter
MDRNLTIVIAEDDEDYALVIERAIIRPIPVPAGGITDLVFLTVLSALVLPICIRGQRTVTRFEAVFLLCLYLMYLVWRISTNA